MSVSAKLLRCLFFVALDVEFRYLFFWSNEQIQLVGRSGFAKLNLEHRSLKNNHFLTTEFSHIFMRSARILTSLSEIALIELVRTS